MCMPDTRDLIMKKRGKSLPLETYLSLWTHREHFLLKLHCKSCMRNTGKSLTGGQVTHLTA